MTLEVLSEALAELNDSIAYYEGQHRGLGERFLAEVASTIEFAVENPQLGSSLPPPATAVRKFVVHRFPFVVLIARNDSVTRVVGITHTSRRPGYWLDRIK